MLLPPETIEIPALAILTMHNYFRQSVSKNIYCPNGLDDVTGRAGHLVEGMAYNDLCKIRNLHAIFK